MLKYIVLLGPPGAGKGTQAGRISRHFNLVHISSGDVFRTEINSGTDLGKTAQKYLAQGQLVPDDVTVGMIKSYLQRSGNGNGFLLDGFPRTMTQAEAIDGIVKSGGAKLAAVIFIDISDAETVRRISSRRQCNKCGNIYSLSQAADDGLNKCRCGGEFIVRQDDRPEVVQERLNVYRAMTAPLIEHYQKQQVLRRVEGEGAVDEITNKIFRILNDAGAGTN